MSRIFPWIVTGAALAALAGCGDDAPSERPADAPGAAGGGDARAAYDRGLDYLLTQQEDGVWMKQTAFTALAVTTLLERPGGVRAADRAVVDKALDHLAAAVLPDGSVETEHFPPNYVTSAAVMALAAGKRPQDREEIDRAAGYLKSLQFLDEKDSSYGGIGYGSDKTRSDLSNTQYALASLRAAGVPESDPVFQRAIVFLNRTQNRKENETPGEPTSWVDQESGKTVVRANDGGANYRPGDSKAGFDERPDGTAVLRSYGSMTYAMLRCYHLAGLPASDPRVKATVDWISKNWVIDRNPGMPEHAKLDGLFYYYMTIGKTLPAAGIDELVTPDGRRIDWRKELAAHLMATQHEDGSWASTDPRWNEDVPALATSFALTALGACVR